MSTVLGIAFLLASSVLLVHVAMRDEPMSPDMRLLVGVCVVCMAASVASMYTVNDPLD